MNIPKRAAFHHFMRSARFASPGNGAAGGWASCAEARRAGLPLWAAIASMAALVLFNRLRRVNMIFSRKVFVWFCWLKGTVRQFNAAIIHARLSFGRHHKIQPCPVQRNSSQPSALTLQSCDSQNTPRCCFPISPSFARPAGGQRATHDGSTNDATASAARAGICVRNSACPRFRRGL
jgi:hypothetical protein